MSGDGNFTADSASDAFSASESGCASMYAIVASSRPQRAASVKIAALASDFAPSVFAVFAVATSGANADWFFHCPKVFTASERNPSVNARFMKSTAASEESNAANLTRLRFTAGLHSPYAATVSESICGVKSAEEHFKSTLTAAPA